jgi:fumarylacetoacetase
MKGFCEKDGIRIGFGEVTGVIEPAHKFNFDKETIDV